MAIGNLHWNSAGGGGYHKEINTYMVVFAYIHSDSFLFIFFLKLMRQFILISVTLVTIFVLNC